MLQRSQPLRIRISGPMALFTRPEMKVERVSYDVITPSAARGVLDAVLWKPGLRWIIQQITVLSPIRFVSLKRNEVANKIPSDFVRWARDNRPDRDFFADDDTQRQQRNAVALRDVDYVVGAIIEMTEQAGPDDSIPKFVGMFQRRVGKGQHYHQPYLGCREFPATVALADGSESPHESFAGNTVELGWMLLDIVYKDGKAVEPRFYQVCMRDGVIDVPQLEEATA